MVVVLNVQMEADQHVLMASLQKEDADVQMEPLLPVQMAQLLPSQAHVQTEARQLVVVLPQFAQMDLLLTHQVDHLVQEADLSAVIEDPNHSVLMEAIQDFKNSN